MAGLTEDDGVRPTQDGIGIAKDIWLVGAGLTVEHLGEHPDPYWANFPNLPERTRATIPMTFSIMARKPG